MSDSVTSHPPMHLAHPRWPTRAAMALLGVLILGAPACEPVDLAEPVSTAEGYAVAYVVDGDTIEVTDSDGATQRVRLLGINAPEVAHHGEDGQCGGEEATAQLEQLLPEGAAVQLVTDSHADTEDRYGRLLRYVETADGTDVGASLIAAGYAYAWTPDSAPEPQRYDDYQDSTDAARIAEAGAWNTCPSLGQSR